jgi:hypothetical protein
MCVGKRSEGETIREFEEDRSGERGRVLGRARMMGSMMMVVGERKGDSPGYIQGDIQANAV